MFLLFIPGVRRYGEYRRSFEHVRSSFNFEESTAYRVISETLGRSLLFWVQLPVSTFDAVLSTWANRPTRTFSGKPDGNVALGARQDQLDSSRAYGARQLNVLFGAVPSDRYVVAGEHTLGQFVRFRICHELSLAGENLLRQNHVVSTDSDPAPSYDAAVTRAKNDASKGKLSCNTAEIAGMTGIPVDLIQRAISGGGLPGLPPQGFSRYLVKVQSLAGWLAMGGPSGGATYVESLEREARDDVAYDPNEPTIDNPKLSYSISEASRATGVSEDKLRRLIRDGYLAAVTPPGFSRLLIRTSELQDWLDSGE